MARVQPSETSHVVIAMRRYPRFINRALRDEYQPSLASDTKLFEDWLSAKRRNNDHNGAFARAQFERRFTLDDQGIENLLRLSRMSEEKDVYLVCQCAQGLRCHREMLLVIARKLLGTKVAPIHNDYPILEAKLLSAQRSAPVEAQNTR